MDEGLSEMKRMRYRSGSSMSDPKGRTTKGRMVVLLGMLMFSDRMKHWNQRNHCTAGYLLDRPKGLHGRG